MSAGYLFLYLNRLQTQIRSFAEDARGNFAIMTGILLVPIVGISGLALDHWAVSTAKSEIENAADAAALAIINRAAAIMRESGNQRVASEIGRNAGNDQFDANVGKIPDTKIEKRKTTLSINGLVLESKIVWSAQSTTRFSSLFNWKRQSLEGISSASVQLPAYVQIHLLVDNSGSMGIGATSEAQKKLFEVTNCAIACHLKDRDGYLIAQKNNIKTRIDIVRDALIEASNNLNLNSTTPNILKMAVSSFSNEIIEIVNIRSDAARSKQAFKDAIETKIGVRGGLELTREGGGTDFHGALTAFTEKIGTRNGSGFSENDPLVYAVFITDGVEHTQQFTGSSWIVDKDLMGVYVSPIPEVNKQTGQTTYRYGGSIQKDSGWVQTIDPNLCRGIKDKKIPLVTLEIEYLVPETQYWLHDGKRDIRFGWIKDNLQVRNRNTKLTLANEQFNACASPGNAYRASSAEDIQTSIKNIFDQIAPKPPRLLK